MAKNPVMFIVEVGSVLTTILFVRDLGAARRPGERVRRSRGRLPVVHRAVRQLRRGDGRGRGKAQAATLRQTRADTVATVRLPDGTVVERRRPTCRSAIVRRGRRRGDPRRRRHRRGHRHRRRVGDHRRVRTGDPRVGGDRSRRSPAARGAVDRIVVQITAKPGETFLDRMIALVEGADRQKTPNEIALSILLAGLTIIFLLAVVTLQPFAIYSGAEQSIIVLVALLVCLIPTTIGGLLSAIGIAGMDRLVQRNVLAMSGARSRPPAT
jgi:K+-transporting ATPase ATPase B chain